MNLYVSVYHHRHGVDIMPMYLSHEPSEKEMEAEWREAKADLELERDDEYLECRGPFPLPVPEFNKHPCDDGGCPGWFVTTDHGAIERCDTCKRFESDEQAVAHVLALEAVDTHYHFDAAAHRALVELREELSSVLDCIKEYRDSLDTDSDLAMLDDIRCRVEEVLGRSFWLERNRWSEHGLQFARLLSELYAMSEESEDSETMQSPGYLSVKIPELCESMSLEWDQILSIFERADMVFQTEKALPKALPEVES